MTERRAFRAGGHLFMLDIPEGVLSGKELLPYAPFLARPLDGEETLFALTLVDNPETLAEEGEPVAGLEDENGCMTVFSREDGGFTFRLATGSGRECGRIDISGDYRLAKGWIGGPSGERRYALDTALMLLFTFASSTRDTLLLHASAVELDGKGYLFLGKSGTGKSTHSRLWLEHIAGSSLLNDDNPIVRIIDGTVYVFGSPWSGKTLCHRNVMIPAGGIVRLCQAPRNRITRLSGIRAYAALLPSCSCMKWNHEMAEAVHASIGKVVYDVPLYSLEALPDKDAALLCHASLVSPHAVATEGSDVVKPQRDE